MIDLATACHWDRSGLLPRKDQSIRPLPATEIDRSGLLPQRDYHCHSRDCKYAGIDKSTILLQKLVRDILRKPSSGFLLRYTTSAICRQTVHSELGRIDQSQWQAVAGSIDPSVVIGRIDRSQWQAVAGSIDPSVVIGRIDQSQCRQW